MSKSNLEAAFSMAWRIYGADAPQPVKQHQFAESIGRKWAFDFAWPEHMLAVEIDGGQWKAHGGRHNTDEDRDKLNHAALLGWRVLRFSGTMLRDPEGCVRMALSALNSEHR